MVASRHAAALGLLHNCEMDAKANGTCDAGQLHVPVEQSGLGAVTAHARVAGVTNMLRNQARYIYNQGSD